MTAIEHIGEHPGNDVTDDLPLLTELADDSLDTIPILTEVIAEPVNQSQSDMPDSQEITVETTEIITESLPVLDTENSASEVATADDDLPSLPDVVDTGAPPCDSEEENIATISEADISFTREFSDEETQHILHQIETLMETVLREKLSRDTVLTEKLSQQLEQLQQMAITQAVDELKAELPEMLRDALNARTKL